MTLNKKSRLLFFFFFTVIALVLASLPFASNIEPVKAQVQTGTPSTVAVITGPPIGFSETSSYVSLNFTMFIIQFDKSAGSSTIYAKNGSILVYYHFMVLQYWNDKVKDWRQAGTFQSLSWTKHDDYHYSVIELFQDASTTPRTNYTITYDIRSDSRVKISIRIESGASRNYRLVWSFDGIVYSSWCEVKNSDNVKCRLCFGNETQPYSFIKFDWQDIYEQFKSDIASYSVTTSAQGKKADIYFDIGTVSGVLTVDPSLVGTSTQTYATQYPYQRKGFYANGRYWVFYSDGTNMVYSTSTDGSTWSSATAIRAATYGFCFSVWFDGTYLHYAYAYSSSIYYRRGTPNSNGTITWSAAEQTVSTTYNTAYYPMVSVDSYGYVWIGYIDYYTGSPYPFVIKSGNNNGTWGTTPSGFPYQLSTTSGNWRVSVIPLTSGKMLVVYAYASFTVRAKRWDGSAWGAEVATTSAIYNGYYYSAVAQGDDVHLVFLKSTGYNIVYVKYTYSTNSFGTETTLQASATSSSAPVISINPSTNDLYVFWAGYPTANHIYYRKYTASTDTWETAVDWIAETETLTGNDRLVCFYWKYYLFIGLMYMTNTASPYNVKFDFVNLNNPPNAPTLNSPAASYRFNPCASVTFSWTFSDNDTDDSQSAYQLQIGNSDFTTIYVDTGKVTSSSTSTTVTLPSTVGIYHWRVTTWDSQDAQGAWSAGRAIIVDRVKVNSLTADDTRRDIGTTVTISVQLVYEYDSGYITSGTFTLNGLTLSYSGSNGVWTATDSKSSVQAITYNSVAGTEGTYGLTTVNMNDKSVTVIWDRIEVYNAMVSDSRADVGSTQYVYFQLRYDYDDVIFDNTKGSVTIGGVTATWDSANSRWYISTSKTTVGSYSYPLSFTDNTYGLTAVTGTTSLNIIFDRLELYGYGVSDNRVNIGDSVIIWVKLRYDYDDVVFDSSKGTVSIGGLSASWDPANTRWYIIESRQTVQKVDYQSPSSFTDNTYGLTVISSSVTQSVIWDRLEVFGYGVSDNRVNVGDTVTIWVKLRYDYDDVTFDSTKGTVSIGGVSATWDSTNGYWYITQSQTAVQRVDYLTPSTFTDNTYGLTAITGTVTQSVVWDRLVISFKGVDDDRRNVNTAGEVRFRLRSEYDSSAVQSGSVYINGTAATWDATNAWWKISYTLSSVGKCNFIISSANWDTYGITALNPGVATNASSIIWDRIEVYDYGVSKSRADVGSSVLFWWKLRYDYDDVVFDSTKGSVTIGGVSATWSSTYSRWELTVTLPSTPQLVTKNLGFTDNTYGLTAVTGTTSQSVIADRIEVYGYGVTKSRTNVGSSVTIWVKLRYDYDDVTFDSSKGTVSIGGISATWDATNGYWYITQSQTSVQKVDYSTPSAFTDNTYGLTAITGTTIQSVIWDKIKVNSLTADDTRRDVGTTVTLSVQLVYEYDSSYITSGSFTLNGLTLTYSGSNGVWRTTSSQSVVTAVTYNSVAGTEGTYGLTVVNMNYQAVTVIWDKVQFTLTVADDRINVGDSAQISVTAKYAYDNTAFQGFYSFNDTLTKTTVGKWGFKVASMTDSLYGLTAFETNAVSVIWDRIKVNSLSADKSRRNVGSTVTLSVQLIYEYDNAYITSGSFTLDSLQLSYSGSNGIWTATDSRSTVQAVTYNTVSGTDGTYGLSTVNMNGKSVTVIWDMLIITYSSNSTNPTVGQAVNISVSAVYAYDNSPVTFSYINTQREGVYFANTTSFTDMSTTEVIYHYTAINASDSTYGITAFSSNTLTISWGGLFVECHQIIVSKTRADIGSSVTISYALRWSYNKTAISSGTLWVNGTAHTISNGWCNFTVSMSSAGRWVFVVTAVNANGKTDYGQIPTNPEVIWDGIKLVSYSLNIAEDIVTIQARYAYDNTPIVGCNVSYAGAFAITDSTGTATFNLLAISPIVWNSVAYPVYEPTYGLTYKAQNQTIAYHKLSYYGFLLRSDNIIGNITWNEATYNLTFETKGTCRVKSPYGIPSRVLVNGQNYTDWFYDDVRQEIQLNNLASIVTLMWTPPSSPTTGGYGGAVVIPSPAPTPQPQSSPPINPIQLETTALDRWLPLFVFVVIAVILIYAGVSPKEVSSKDYWKELWR